MTTRFKIIYWVKDGRFEIDIMETPNYHVPVDDLHRLDGPAIIWPNGTKEWYVDGKVQNLKGPAIVRKNGYKAWWLNNHLHRLDGPAVESSDGEKRWRINGMPLPAKEVEKWLKENNIDLSTDEGQVAFKLRWS